MCFHLFPKWWPLITRSTESRTPDIGCLKMSASPEVQPPGLQSTGLRRCPCLKKADRFGSAPSRTSECANRPQITEKSTGLCQEFWSRRRDPDEGPELAVAIAA